jgi:hypothetical protein
MIARTRRVRLPRTIIGVLVDGMNLIRQPVLLVWSLFVLLIPFYVLPSGLPQPGDVLAVPLVLIALRTWNGRLDRRSRRPLLALFAFTIWVVVVDWGWALLLGNFGLFGPDTFLLFPIYYIYNTLVFLVVCVLYQRYGKQFLWLTLNIVFLSVIAQTGAALVLHRGSSFRGVGFFNNPNQLGFFALVCASILTLGRRSLGFGSFKTSLALCMCFYLALLSASRAAVIGSGLLFMLTVVVNPRRLAVMAVVVLGLVAIGGPLSDAIDDTQQRLAERRYPQFNFFQERGYDRILANKEYWFLGAGEGGTGRFAESTLIGATEIHSSVGTLFFSYGIVGVALFLVFLYRVVQSAPLRTTIILLPSLSYTIAHQGLRATSVWILFAVFVCIKHMLRAAPAPVAPQGAPQVASLKVSPA